ncbi:MAG: SAM-dependent methyltransferase, partial [Puniceicoccales bacterium]|nr:SAM-dependent methyltransferase [Puniceicoccales bacterium]
MKYAKRDIVIPHEKREEYNKRCLAVVEGENKSLTPEDVAAFYTGIGGLHGLSASDFGDYSSYSTAKKQYEHGQFFTDYNLAQWVVDCVQPNEDDIVADLTCGHGSFFNCLPNEKRLIGIELEENAWKVAKFLYPDAQIRHADIMEWVPSEAADIVIGNPPFGLRWIMRGEEMKSEYCYCVRAADVLVPGGILAVIVPH